jgi:hypothetical protein
MLDTRCRRFATVGAVTRFVCGAALWLPRYLSAGYASTIDRFDCAQDNRGIFARVLDHPGQGLRWRATGVEYRPTAAFERARNAGQLSPAPVGDHRDQTVTVPTKDPRT